MNKKNKAVTIEMGLNSNSKEVIYIFHVKETSSSSSAMDHILTRKYTPIVALSIIELCGYEP